MSYEITNAQIRRLAAAALRERLEGKPNNPRHGDPVERPYYRDGNIVLTPEEGDPIDAAAVIIGNGVLSHGDYMSGGALGRANVKVFRGDHSELENHGLVAVVGGGYGSQWIECASILVEDIDAETCEVLERLVSWDPEDESLTLFEAVGALNETLRALDDYPVLDDNALYDQEREEQESAWDDWASGDFRKALCSRFDLEDFDVSSDRLSKLFHDACEHANAYWEQDGDAQWIDVDRVAESVDEQDIIDDLAALGVYPGPDDIDDDEPEAILLARDYRGASVTRGDGSPERLTVKAALPDGRIIVQAASGEAEVLGLACLESADEHPGQHYLDFPKA